MQANVLRWLVLSIGMLALAGCQHSSPADCQHSQPVGIALRPVPPSQPFVFYDETGDPPEKPPPLSEAEVREIIDWVAAQTPDRVWLIRVKLWIGEGRHGSVVAHLVPDEATPRIRAGRAYNVPASRRQTGTWPPWRYVQVSLPNHDFTEELTKPTAAEMPFEWPRIWARDSNEASPMSEEEILAIADFVRSPSSYRHIPKIPEKGWEEAMVHGIFESPIFQINRTGNEIVVTLGFMHGFLWGAGVRVEVRCTPIGYRVVDRSLWMS